jgi:PAS domain S-box-containing protein
MEEIATESPQTFWETPSDETLNIPITPEEAKFYDAAFAKFGNILRWKEGETLRSWSENLLEQLVPFVGGMQGSLYYTETERKELVYASGYAVDYEQHIKKRYRFGEGLIGQVAENKDVLMLHDGMNFISLTSTQRVRLKCVIILPLVYNTRTTGIMELNFPQRPTDRHLKFLKLISESIASNLNALVKEQELELSFKKLQASEERLKRLAEVTSEGIAMIDNQHKLVEWNGAFEKIFGYAGTAQELKGMHFLDLFQTNEEERRNFLQQIRGDIPLEMVGIRANGSTLDLEVQEGHIDSTKQLALNIVSVRDISRRKQAESKLQRTEERLEAAEEIVELTEIIRTKNKQLTASLNYAKRIQDALLPESEFLKDVLPQSFIYYRPKDVVSGDFYWFTQEDKYILLGALDCTGHGVPGAIMAMAGTVFLKQIVNLQGITSPDEVLTELHFNVSKALKQQETRNRDGMDASLCRVDFENRVITFAGAKNTLIYFLDGVLHEVVGDSFPIGGHWNKSERTRIFKKKNIQLPAEPTTCYLFTDGYEDQFGGKEGRKFMKKNFRKLLADIQHLDMQEQRQILDRTLNEWMLHERQTDDILVVGFRI